MEEFYPQESCNALRSAWRSACRRAVNRVCLAMLAAFLLSQGSGMLLILALERFVPGSLEDPWVSMAVSTFPLYLLGIPAAMLVMGGLPRAELREAPGIGLKRTLAFAASTYTLFYLFQFFSMQFNTFLGLLLDRELYNPTQFLVEMSPLVSFLVSGILGPLMEELLFRGAVLRRLMPYGNGFAIFLSALLFGLFHGNFYQMFYAFGIGLALAYITIRTGSLFHAALMHILFNCIHGVLLPLLPLGGQVAVGLVCLAVAVVGAVVLVVCRRRISALLGWAPMPFSQAVFQCLRAPGFWAGLAAFGGAAVYLLFSM